MMQEGVKLFAYVGGAHSGEPPFTPARLVSTATGMEFEAPWEMSPAGRLSLVAYEPCRVVSFGEPLPDAPIRLVYRSGS